MFRSRSLEGKSKFGRQIPIEKPGENRANLVDKDNITDRIQKLENTLKGLRLLEAVHFGLLGSTYTTRISCKSYSA